MPGVALGLLAGGAERAFGLGVTSREHPLPVDADTLFQTGSITKVFTAAAVMRLVDRGGLDLDAPVRTYLPDLRLADEATAAAVTLRHLLTHTGGWAGDFLGEGTGRGDDALSRQVAQLVDTPQVAPLGHCFSYNNTGLQLAGRVVEVVTGQTYEDALRELVLDPLGMRRSCFFADDAITERTAVGHRRGEVVRPWALYRCGHPSGGLASTVREQLVWARFWFGDGAPLLAPASFRAMRAPAVETGQDHRLGLTWFVKEVGGVRILAHAGAVNGQQSLLTIAPESGFALVVLTNAEGGAALCNEVTAWALREHLGVEEPPPGTIELPPARLAEYVGTYRNPRWTWEVRLGEGGLVLEQRPNAPWPDPFPTPPAPPPTRLAFYGPDRVRGLDEHATGLRADFVREPGGAIGWMRSGRVLRKERT